MRKLVLHDDADLGVRLRLHLYRGGFFDRPHNHRWSFASRILHGGYRHRLFGRDDQYRKVCQRTRGRHRPELPQQVMNKPPGLLHRVNSLISGRFASFGSSGPGLAAAGRLPYLDEVVYEKWMYARNASSLSFDCVNGAGRLREQATMQSKLRVNV
jgi:hypothetical protein